MKQTQNVWYLKNVLRLTGAAPVCVALLLASCATKPNVYKNIDGEVDAAAFDKAIAEIEASEAVPEGKKAPKNPVYGEKNTILLSLDKGILEHYAGRYEASYKDLTDAERKIEEAYTKSLSQDISSYVANDNTKDYAGEDYEDVYVNIFNALNAYHLNNGQALALINDLTAQGGELQVLADKYAEDNSKVKEFLGSTLKVAGTVFSIGTVEWPAVADVTFTNSALARYLAAVFYLADGNKDSARYNLFELQNAFTTPVYEGFGVPASLAVTGERGSETGPILDIPAGKGQLNVLAFSGLSPIKVEKVENILLPFLQTVTLKTGKVKVPDLRERPSAISSVSVSVQGGPSFDLELLENIGAVLTDTFKGHQSSVYLKTFTRVLAKYIVADIAATKAVKEAVDNGKNQLLAISAGAGIALFAKKGLDATEAADIRSARYLPAKAYVGAVNLDPGNYTISVNYAGGTSSTHNVAIKPGAISLVEAVCLK
ncbi:MAG: hypothetical protein LBO04_03060 [Spirochaetaceae bacterium]|jgi:hypothetical protein|nr:hypothetical protein [Spirochaetaceae bacterium]